MSIEIERKATFGKLKWKQQQHTTEYMRQENAKTGFFLTSNTCSIYITNPNVSIHSCISFHCWPYHTLILTHVDCQWWWWRREHKKPFNGMELELEYGSIHFYYSFFLSFFFAVDFIAQNERHTTLNGIWHYYYFVLFFLLSIGYVNGFMIFDRKLWQKH